MVDTCNCNYLFVQTHSMYNPKSEPQCHCRLISCNVCSTPVGDVDGRGGCAFVGAAICGKSLSVPSTQLCHDCSTTWKSIKKNTGPSPHTHTNQKEIITLKMLSWWRTWKKEIGYQVLNRTYIHILNFWYFKKQIERRWNGNTNQLILISVSRSSKKWD